MEKLRNHDLRMLRFRTGAALHDFAVSCVAFLLALLVRLDSESFTRNDLEYFFAAALFGLTVSVVGFALGINRGVWRYASLPDLVAIMKAATVSVAIFIAAQFFLVRLDAIPRSSIVISWAFLVVFLSGSRALYRLYRNRRDVRRHRNGAGREPKLVLLVGANDNADLFLKAIAERRDPLFRVLGIIDERGRRTGRFIRNVPVLAGVEHLPQIVARFEEKGVRPQALILMRSRNDYEQHARIGDLVEFASRARIDLLRVPDLPHVQSLDQGIEVLPVQLEDLLQRPQLHLDQAEIAALIEDKTILITGAGGSIGSEIARQVAALRPRKLVVLDASEFLLYSITSELSHRACSFNLRSVLCNVRERKSVRLIFTEERPDIVIHAAALKHVPIVEAQPLEGILTNVIGTRNVAEAAQEVGASAMILVSTDKAVNPTSVMGATKRLAEMFCQAMDLDAAGSATRFVTVRFGNVLGSAGSVVPLFEKQIKAGGPVTITHPQIERYFMTIPEACVLVLQAAARCVQNDEDRGRIFILDMGTPVKIVDLARNLIYLSGFRPDVDIKIVYTGLRPGEKLYEELFDAGETLKHTGAAGVLAASPRFIARALIVRIVDDLQQRVEKHDVAGALRLLKESEPSFTPDSEIAALMMSDRPVNARILAEGCR